MKQTFEIVFEYTTMEGDNAVYLHVGDKIVKHVFTGGYTQLTEVEIIGLRTWEK